MTVFGEVWRLMWTVVVVHVLRVPTIVPVPPAPTVRVGSAVFIIHVVLRRQLQLLLHLLPRHQQVHQHQVRL